MPETAGADPPHGYCSGREGTATLDMDEVGTELSTLCQQATVDLPAGPIQIVARAWDSSAATQPESAEQLWNPKGYVNNSWARVQVTVGSSRS